MKEKNNNNIDDPTQKYENNNFISKKLINNFFNSINLLAPNDIQNILEIGCGPGYSINHLLTIFKNKNFEASDIDMNFVKIAKKKNKNIQIKTESIYNLKRDEKSFDLILALEVLEHLKKPKDALKEIKRVTKKYAIISVPYEPIWCFLNMLRFKYLKDFGNTPGHINHWNIKKFKKLIEKDFKILKIKTPLPWMIFLLEIK